MLLASSTNNNELNLKENSNINITNIKLLELYNIETFKSEYDNSEKFRNKLNTNEEFLELQYLLYTDSKFKEIYNNEDFNLLYNKYKLFRTLYRDNEKFRNSIHNNKMLIKLQYMLATCIEYKKLYLSNEEFRKTMNNPEILELEYLLIKELNRDNKFKKLYNNKNFTSLYKKYPEFRNEYYNNKKFKNDIYNEEFLELQYLLYTDSKFREIYNNINFQEKYNNDKEFKKLYNNNKNIQILFKNRFFLESYFNNDTIDIQLENSIQPINSDILYIDNELFRNLYNNDIYFRVLYLKNEYFAMKCNINLEFIEQYNRDTLHNFLFNIFKRENHEYKLYIPYMRTVDFNKSYCHLNINNPVRLLYNSNKEFQILLLNSNFFSSYFDDYYFKEKINTNSKFLKLQFHSYMVDNFKELYNNKDFKYFYDNSNKITNLCDNEDFIANCKININETAPAGIYLLYTLCLDFFKEFVNKDNLLYFFNREFQLLCINSEEFRIKYRNNIDNFRERIHNDKEFFDFEFLSHMDNRFLNFYNNNEEFRNIYNNQEFRELYFLKEFRDNYHNNQDQFINKIHNNENFFIFQKLYYKDERFLDQYENNNYFRKKYNKELKFQEIYNKYSEFREKYHNDIRFKENVNNSPEIINHIYFTLKNTK